MSFTSKEVKIYLKIVATKVQFESLSQPLKNLTWKFFHKGSNWEGNGNFRVEIKIQTLSDFKEAKRKKENFFFAVVTHHSFSLYLNIKLGWQFHQHFTCNFSVQKCFGQIFCAYSLGCYFFWQKKISAKAAC